MYKSSYMFLCCTNNILNLTFCITLQNTSFEYWLKCVVIWWNKSGYKIMDYVTVTSSFLPQNKKKKKISVFIIKNIITISTPTFQKWNAYFHRRCRLHLIAYFAHHIRFLNIFHPPLRSCFCNRKKAADELCISYCWPCTAYFHLVSIFSWNSFSSFTWFIFKLYIDIEIFFAKQV